jgi:hypothetical protein
MAQTELARFKYYCRNSPITVEFLIANQTIYEYDCIAYCILECICSNPKLTIQVLQWLLSNYPDSILYCFETIIKSNLNVFPMEKYILLIDHIIKIKGNLYWKFVSGKNILHSIFLSESFDVPMLNYLYQKDPQLDIGCEGNCGISPLYCVIIKSPRLLELLQVIKSYEPANSRTHIKLKYIIPYYCEHLKDVVNDYARFYSPTILVLIGLCGELFSLISPEYLSQDICSQFYSSKYFCWSTDPDSLIKLIPEQFPRKPCRLWRNQFAGCEFSWTKNKTCFPSPIRT